MIPANTAAAGLCVALTLSAALSACSAKKPEGQVVAVVNGEEVTRRELAGEPNVADQADSNPALAAVLAGVVDRKLAVAEAQRLELDETPQYVAQAKRLQEVMLSRTLFDRWAADMPAPAPAKISAYIAGNPQQFGQRKLFLVDRITTEAAGVDQADLKPLASNDAVAAYLGSRNHTFQRERTVIDSATLPLPLYRQLLQLDSGYPLALAQGDALTVVAVVQARDEPLTGEDAAARAVVALKQEGVQRKLATLRKSATIAYQPGYRPPAPAAKP